MSLIRNSVSPIIALFATILIAASSYPKHQGEPISNLANQAESECPVRALVNMAFIIDRSGSMDPNDRGQTFNMQIEGVARALRDPSIIPCDGSVAVSVFTFAETPTLRLSLTEIKSRADAESAASQVEALKCACKGPTLCPAKGPVPGSNFGAAIEQAYNHLGQSGSERQNARRLLLLSTDGGCTDEGCGLGAVEEARKDAARRVVGFELDTILVGLKPYTQEHTDSKHRVNPLATPQPPGDLPGATLTIEAGKCNIAEQCAFVDNCVSQADGFADKVRRILRSDVAPENLTVNTGGDTPANETPEAIAAQNIISLRRAITLANARGGNTTITFEEQVTRIMPTAPLPAITQPDIAINGNNAVTIDGSLMTAPDVNGLLIRASRTIITRMKIINFRGAGIKIVPCCGAARNTISENQLENNVNAGILLLDSSDNTISENRLENNVNAGILLLDSSGEAVNSLRNTLSENIISGESLPIDLGGDGATANDACDGDEGPNHLINHPEFFMTTEDGDLVRIEGRVGGELCPVAGAKVEIFSVTIPDSASAQSAIRTVTPVGTAFAGSEGRFTASIANTLVIGYTATVTDAEGNTSEMIPFCTTSPTAEIDDDRLRFARIEAQSEPLTLDDQPSADFTITVRGCSRLPLRFESIERKQERGITNRRDDRAGVFSVSRIINRGNPMGEEEVPFEQDGLSVEPGADKAVTFRVRFNPVIPTLAECRCSTDLSASEALPNKVNSTLTISFNNVVRKTIALKGHVKTAPRLINLKPGSPRLPALVTLTRSGDVLTVGFSVYDSNMDLREVRYEFFDERGNSVPVDVPTTQLSQAMEHLVRGQSFSAEQRFSNAREHPEVSRVRVTIVDRQEKNDFALSGPLASPAISSRSAAVRISGANPLRALRPSVFQILLRSAPEKNERRGRRR